MKAWFDLGNGRKVYRTVPDRTDAARSSLPAPHFVCDTMPETQSMLDGKYYTSKSELRATYKAAGMIELGNEEMAPFKAPEKDRKGQRDAIERAICEVEAGNAPPVLTKLPTF